MAKAMAVLRGLGPRYPLHGGKGPRNQQHGASCSGMTRRLTRTRPESESLACSCCCYSTKKRRDPLELSPTPLRGRRTASVLTRASDDKVLKELDADWEMETRPGLFTRIALALCLVVAGFSGGTIVLRIVASIFAIFLACIRYIFISVVLLFVLSLLWQNPKDA